MPSTLIGPDLENNENEMEEPKVHSVEENQASVLLEKKYKICRINYFHKKRTQLKK